METATQKHQQLTTELIEIIEDFHKTNHDLFVENIKVHYKEAPTTRKIFCGLEVNITVQPPIFKNQFQQENKKIL